MTRREVRRLPATSRPRSQARRPPGRPVDSRAPRPGATTGSLRRPGRWRLPPRWRPARPILRREIAARWGGEFLARTWLAKDTRCHGGDGLGPVYNATSCVDCHNQGGPGGGGPADRNVQLAAGIGYMIFGDTSVLVDRTGIGWNFGLDLTANKADLISIHPRFRDASAVVLHRFGVDPNYSDMGEDLSDAESCYGENSDSSEGSMITQEWRTPPLWGFRDSAPYLHDGRARNLVEAVALHRGQGERLASKFRSMSDRERSRVETFLNSLVAPGAAVHLPRRGSGPPPGEPTGRRSRPATGPWGGQAGRRARGELDDETQRVRQPSPETRRELGQACGTPQGYLPSMQAGRGSLGLHRRPFGRGRGLGR